MLDRRRPDRDLLAAPQPPGRQRRVPRCRPTAGGEASTRARPAAFEERVLLPRMSYAHDDRMMLGYQCAHSRMTVAVAADHVLDTERRARGRSPAPTTTWPRWSSGSTRPQGSTIRLEKTVAYHSSRGVPVRELVRPVRPHPRPGRAARRSTHYLDEQRAWFDDFWAAADVEVVGDDRRARPSSRRSASTSSAWPRPARRTDGLGVPAKGVTGSGYEGHYFWDTEIYVDPVPDLHAAEWPATPLHFRSRDAAGRPRAGPRDGAERRAVPVAHHQRRGGLGVLRRRHRAGAHRRRHRLRADEVRPRHRRRRLPGRARASTSWWRPRGCGPTSASGAATASASFHIHGVTGPDEYTTVVNNNLFTNVMARYNLEQAVAAVERIRDEHPRGLRPGRRPARAVTTTRSRSGGACAEGMTIPFDEGLGIHPQDDFFLDREVWDLSKTPDELRPLLLHYHPLVIYRFQVLKQADVVLALFLQGDRFTAEEKRADFEYYDPITTGDSTLSAVVQSVIAAEVGYHEVALRLLPPGAVRRPDDLHDNTVDGLHVASTGGVWSALVFGFGGMRDHGGALSLRPAAARGLGGAALPLLLARHPGAGRADRGPDRASRSPSGDGRRRRSTRPRHVVRRHRRRRRSSSTLDGQGHADRRAARRPPAHRRHPRRRQHDHRRRARPDPAAGGVRQHRRAARSTRPRRRPAQGSQF